MGREQPTNDLKHRNFSFLLTNNESSREKVTKHGQQPTFRWHKMRPVPNHGVAAKNHPLQPDSPLLLGVGLSTAQSPAGFSTSSIISGSQARTMDSFHSLNIFSLHHLHVFRMGNVPVLPRSESSKKLAAIQISSQKTYSATNTDFSITHTTTTATT